MFWSIRTCRRLEQKYESQQSLLTIIVAKSIEIIIITASIIPKPLRSKARSLIIWIHACTKKSILNFNQVLSLNSFHVLTELLRIIEYSALELHESSTDGFHHSLNSFRNFRQAFSISKPFIKSFFPCRTIASWIASRKIFSSLCSGTRSIFMNRLSTRIHSHPEISSSTEGWQHPDAWSLYVKRIHDDDAMMSNEMSLLSRTQSHSFLRCSWWWRCEGANNLQHQPNCLWKVAVTLRCADGDEREGKSQLWQIIHLEPPIRRSMRRNR